MCHWKKFWPVWVIAFAWCMVGPFVASPNFYEEHPAIAWPVLLALMISASLYMIFLKGLMLRIVSDKSMSAATRSFLWLVPTFTLAVLGMLLGFWLKSQFTR